MKKNVSIKIRETFLVDGKNYFTYSFDQHSNFYSIGEQTIDLSSQDNHKSKIELILFLLKIAADFYKSQYM